MVKRWIRVGAAALLVAGLTGGGALVAKASAVTVPPSSTAAQAAAAPAAPSVVSPAGSSTQIQESAGPQVGQQVEQQIEQQVGPQGGGADATEPGGTDRELAQETPEKAGAAEVEEAPATEADHDNVQLEQQGQH